MIDVGDYLKRTSQRSGFKRVFYLEKNIPTQTSNIMVIPFYGDIRATFVLSSLLLKPFKELNKDRYIILCSWNGMQGLFPYVDEYWAIEDEFTIKKLALGADGFYNKSNMMTEFTRRLVEVFDLNSEINVYYNNGFTNEFWQKFKEVKLFLPEIPSVSKIGEGIKNQIDSKTGTKVVVYPSTKMRSRQQGKTIYLPVSQEFWSVLIKRLLTEGFVPVIYQNCFTYDMSREFVDQCLYLSNKNIIDILTFMRHIGCVLDIHSGVSRLALLARCPFLSVIERQSYIKDKDYEIDDLCSLGLSKQYLFSFSTMLMNGEKSDWDTSLLDAMIIKLKEFCNSKNTPISTNEFYDTISCDNIRKREAKRLGLVFVKKGKYNG